MDWYALFVETGKEDVFQSLIRKRFNETEIHAIVPKRKLKEKKQGKTYEVCRTIFPGYVLVHTQMNVKTYYKLKQIPRYYRLLNRYKYNDVEVGESDFKENFFQSYLFSKVNPGEMEVILQLVDDDEVIDYSTVYVENAKVTVCSGSLEGKEGIIKRIDKRKKRSRIALEFMGKGLLLDFGIEILEI